MIAAATSSSIASSSSNTNEPLEYFHSQLKSINLYNNNNSNVNNNAKNESNVSIKIFKIKKKGY